MKKKNKFCKNCKYFSDENSPCAVVFTDDKNISYAPYYATHTANTCKYYKRIWWKFWIK